MNTRMSKASGRERVVAAIGLAIALFMMSGSTGLAQSKRSATRNIEGTWFVQITLRNCATNASLGSFNSLVTFHDGGTITESTSSPAFAIGQRGPGHGDWAFEGDHLYSQRMVSLINFDTAPNLPGTPGFDPTLPVSPGFFAGWSEVTHMVKVTGRNHLTSAGTNEFYKADGTLYRSGCSTAVATRFE
jgi:hypothetical protein